MTKEALDHLIRADKRLGRLIQKVGPCLFKLKNHRSPFQALVESVAYQQLNGTAAATILGRVKALYPHRRFPTPADLLSTPDERLRSAGLSRAKTAAIKDIAKQTQAGVIPTSRAISNLSDLEIIGARRIPSFARSATGHLVMRDMTRRLADRRILWTLDRKPRGANLQIVGLSASCLAATFVTRTT